MTEPTDRDRANAAYRQAVADRQLAVFRHAEAIRARALQPGWRRTTKLSLLRIEDCRPAGPDDPAPVPVAVSYKVSYWLMDERSR
jgi:hypothetical protein